MLLSQQPEDAGRAINHADDGSDLRTTDGHSRLATIIAICNTMLGSTLLSITWAWSQSGLLMGCALFCLVGVISFYTCTLIVKHGDGYSDLPEAAREFLGKWAETLAIMTSILVLIAAAIAYHLYMTDALMDIVSGIASFRNSSIPSSSWNPTIAALIIAAVVLPICCAPKMTLLVKFNSFGIFFVMLLLVFMAYEAGDRFAHHEDGPQVMFKPSFGELLGVISLAFFIHNCILSLLRPHPGSVPQKNFDVGMSYILASICYLVPGAVLSAAFAGTDVKQNLLNMFSATDGFAFAARASILLQLILVLPLLIYVIRVQFYSYFFRDHSPGFVRILLLTLVVITTTTLFAIFYPNVGTILRFAGAFAGLVYLYLLPIGIHVVRTRRKGGLSVPSTVFHGLLMLVGISGIVLQFV